MPLKETMHKNGTEAKRVRARPTYGLLRSAMRREWILAIGPLALLALVAWIDFNFGSLAGVRTLYILPIWLVVRTRGVIAGLTGALVVSVMLSMIDLVQSPSSEGVDAWGGISWFVSLAAVTLVVAHVEKRLREARLMATRDPLTGVLNRTEMRVRVEEAMSRSRAGGPVVLFALVDCDKFKTVNDIHGHACGDKALRALAKILQTCARQQGTVGRMGGDEFAVMFDGVSEQIARGRMEHAARCFRRHTCVIGCEATFSFGLVADSEGSLRFSSLLESADRQMYAQKRVNSSRSAPAEGPSTVKNRALTTGYGGAAVHYESPI